MSNTRQLALFFAIAFKFTWAVGGCMMFWRVRIEFLIVASLGPTIAALITQRLATGNWRAFHINGSWPRTAAAVLVGAVLVLASEIIFPAVAAVDPGKLRWGALFALGNYNWSTLLGGPLTEEPGWRGFALPRLQTVFHPIIASVLLGGIWAAWHVPFFWFPGWSECPIPTYFLILTGFSVMLGYATNLARGGVIAAIVMHAVHNTSGSYFRGLFADAGPGEGGLLNSLVRALPDHWRPNVSLSFYTLIAIGAWLGAAVVIAATRGRLNYPGASISSPNGPAPA